MIRIVRTHSCIRYTFLAAKESSGLLHRGAFTLTAIKSNQQLSLKINVAFHVYHSGLLSCVSGGDFSVVLSAGFTITLHK